MSSDRIMWLLHIFCKLYATGKIYKIQVQNLGVCKPHILNFYHLNDLQNIFNLIKYWLSFDKRTL